MKIRITRSRLDAWRKRWPCSSLVTGWFEIDDRNGDLIGLSPALERADVQGYELDAFQETYGPQSGPTTIHNTPRYPN